ncbi:MAG: LemA family protein [Cyclobacteriaceae bacterium]|nr:LemA family protein [Cyclobacteriaceae bacterium]MDW8331464.1 LemA family protein [Cyclobacteriaceae bacterium]
MQQQALIIGISALALALICCRRQQERPVTEFTRVDSVTHQYLEYKDSLMDAWNRMMHEDNRRIAALKSLIHELLKTPGTNQQLLHALAFRTEQLLRIRFTPKTISNYDVVEEYDFAVNSVTTELLALAGSSPDFFSNQHIQKLVEEIKETEKNVTDYRLKYDIIASRYNYFLEQHRDLLHEIDKNAAGDKRSLFQLAEE